MPRGIYQHKSIVFKDDDPRIKHGFTRKGVDKTTRNFNRKFHRMKSRCYNPNDASYVRYSGKGIKVEWKSFEDFRDDMYESYKKHLAKHGAKDTTLDRINNDGNYCKENCRWATNLQQIANRTTTIKKLLSILLESRNGK